MQTKPTILITNDDGIYAPGLLALWQELSSTYNTVVVAPDTEKSAVGHAITVSDPLRIRTIERSGGLSGYAVNGTPADCVKIAINALMENAPDVIISGVNKGANVGNNIIYSGTVSAATEGTMLGIPSIAISRDTFVSDSFESSKKVAAVVVKQVLERGLPEGVLLNVNVPNLPFEEINGIKITRQGNLFFRDWFEKREDPHGRMYYWMTGEIIDPDKNGNTDSNALSENYVSITPIHYQLTNEAFLKELKQWTF